MRSFFFEFENSINSFQEVDVSLANEISMNVAEIFDIFLCLETKLVREGQGLCIADSNECGLSTKERSGRLLHG